MLSRSFFAAALAASCVSCAPANTGADGGAAGSQTVGDQCSAIAQAFCEHAINDCLVLLSLGDCTSNEMAMCCVGSACNAISNASPAALDACTSAIPTEDCNSVVNASWQGLAACQSVPSPP